MTGRHLENSFSIYGVCHSTCSLSRFWVPVALSLTAVYSDDYAKFILDDTPSNIARLLTLLRECVRRIPVVGQGENASHDLPYDLPTFMQA